MGHDSRWESFDREKPPVRQNAVFLPFIWLACFLITRYRRLKVRRIHMEKLRPPYLVLSTHHGFVDFYVAPAVLFPHRANYISELEGFEGKEWLYRQAGCLCKRKFTQDFSLIRNIKYVTEHNKDIIVIYPEARYCNVGTNSSLPAAVGKLIKILDVPVVLLTMRGNYLLSPIWNLRKRRVRLEADLEQILTRDQIHAMKANEINELLAEKFVYDDYRWQKEQKIRISYKKRAEGLHKALYRCPHCKTEYRMDSKGAVLYCGACGKEWEMTEYGELAARSGNTEFTHIPDWYEDQRLAVKEEITRGEYSSIAPVRIEALPNARGFIDMGNGNVTHNQEGYVLEFMEQGEEKRLIWKPLEMTSVHTEYDYRNKGECITLSTLDNTYFLFPLIREFNVTKVQFATEVLYERAFLARRKERERACRADS